MNDAREQHGGGETQGSSVPPPPAEQVRLRDCLEALPAYVPGRPAADDGVPRIKASSNESPFPPLPSVLDAAIAAMTHVNRYPDLAASQLRAAIAERHDVDPGQVVVSTGAVAVLGDLVRALVDPGDEVIFPWRSFEAYPILVGSHGGVSVPVALDAQLRPDADGIIAALTERTRLVLLCTPNNPSGTSLSTAWIEDLLARIPPQVVVAVDEAYREFHDPHTVADTAAVFARHANVVLVRTFSKLQGLAGLRLGYAIAHPRLAAALATVTIPFGASLPAQAAGRASLDADVQEELARRAAWIREQRDRVQEGLAQQGWDLPASQGNFVFLPLGRESAEFAAFADARGLVVRPYGEDGVRVTIAEQEANDRLLEIGAAWRAEHERSGR